MYDKTTPTHSDQQLLLPTTTAQRNARSHSTEAPPSLLTISTTYETQAEKLLAFLAVFPDILEKAHSTSHAEEIFAVQKDPCFHVSLFNTRRRKPENCRCVVSKLIISFHTKHHLRTSPSAFVLDSVYFLICQCTPRTIFQTSLVLLLFLLRVVNPTLRNWS